MRTLTSKYLDPASWMGELLFGLIMTLTFTLAADIVIEEEGREGARAMLIGILGCNLAWGIIDGVLYVLGQLFERARLRRVGAYVRKAGSAADGQQAVARELDDLLEPVTDDAARRQLYATIAERLRANPPAPNRITEADVRGGIAAGWIVFACSFPAVAPFLLFDDLHRALRVSNCILLALLFAGGYYQAKRHTLARPWLTGLAFTALGLLLVAIAIPLGG